MPARNIQLTYNLDELRRILDHVIRSENALDLVLSALQSPVCEVLYEDLCADPSGQVKTILQTLGYRYPESPISPTLKRQVSGQKTQFVNQLREDLRLKWGISEREFAM